MVHFTFVIYAPEMQTMHMDARLWGWNLVGYAESLPYANKAPGSSRFPRFGLLGRLGGEGSENSSL